MPTKPPPSPVGPNIKAARERKGLSQLALARALGFKGDDAGAYVCRVESGKTEPLLKTLVRFARALGVTIESLIQK